MSRCDAKRTIYRSGKYHVWLHPRRPRNAYRKTIDRCYRLLSCTRWGTRQERQPRDMSLGQEAERVESATDGSTVTTIAMPPKNSSTPYQLIPLCWSP